MFQLVLQQICRTYIHHAFEDIDEDRYLCRTACQGACYRGERCCNVGGGYFEHLKRLNSFCVRYN